MDYSNILKAVGSQSPQMEDLNRRTDNYRIAEEASKNGTSLADMIRRMEDLEAKVKTLESHPSQDANAELLAVMEASVRNDPEIRDARRRVADIKTAIITEMCAKDSRYVQAVEDYKTTVNRVYIRSRERDDRTEVEAED